MLDNLTEPNRTLPTQFILAKCQKISKALKKAVFSFSKEARWAKWQKISEAIVKRGAL